MFPTHFLSNRKSAACIVILFFQLAVVSVTNAQPIFERHNYEVYPFLSRMAQKGLIVWDDNIQPVLRPQILAALDTLSAHSTQLTNVEKAELHFYKKQYDDKYGKLPLGYASDQFTLKGLPVIGGSVVTTPDGMILRRSIGARAWGQISKRWGYQLSFQDITETGDRVDTSKKSLLAGPETGAVPQGFFTVNEFNYGEFRGQVTYSFNKGSVSLAHDYLMWGYGQGGRLVLSDKAPTYPQIRFDFAPLPWLRFNYVHAWLKSDIPDSARSYTIPNGLYGGVREVFVPKFMASHSIDLRIMKGLNFSFGESIIYTDNLNIAYLIPVMFFKAFDNYAGSRSITRGNNGQFFFQLSSRNQLRNTHLYANLLIDEIKISEVFNPEQQRNQLGYTLGASVTDVGVSYLTIGAEYTKIRPFVYRNFLPAQNYTSASYLLGDWIGMNADRIFLFARYTPIPRLKLTASYMRVRKGADGTLDQQYFQQPQPAFLFGQTADFNELSFQGSYELWPRLYLHGGIRAVDGQQRISAGMHFGL